MRSCEIFADHIPGCCMQLADWPRVIVPYGLHVPHLLLSHPVVECSHEPSMTRTSLPVIKSDCLFFQLSVSSLPNSCNDPPQSSSSAIDSLPKTLSVTCPEGLLCSECTIHCIPDPCKCPCVDNTKPSTAAPQTSRHR